MKENSTNEDSNKSVDSSGERSVSVGGNISQSTIHTGDVYNIYPQETQVSPIIKNIYESKIENLSTDLSKEKASKLEDLREKFREGYFDEGFEGVCQLKKSSNWDAFEPALRAGILRALASMTLAVKGKKGIDETKKLAEEARQNEETLNDDVLLARIKVYEQGFEAAIEDFAKIKNIEAYNLWLNCLLNSGKIEDVLSARKNPPVDIVINVETRRFYALALLASKNIDDADKEIKKAIIEKPGWQYIRFTAAIIDYYGAISPSVLPPHLVSYPRPFPFGWVKIDNQSQQKLNGAAEEFAKLAEQFKEGSREERESRTWHFACLANQLGKQNEAVEIGKKILEKDPTDLQILSWFLFRGYECDYQKSLKALEEKEIGDDPSIEDLLGLIGIYLRQSNWKTALEVIEKRKKIFASAGEINLWRYWRGTALLYGERVTDAEGEVTEITDGELKKLLTLNILSYKGEKHNDWKPLIEYLRERYKKDEDYEAFLSLYEIKVQKVRDEKFVVEKAELYCEKTQTASAVDFVVNALWSFGRPQKCIDLLEKYEFLFPDNKLPGYLHRLKIHSLLKTDVVKGLEEAEALVKKDGSVENVALLMDSHLVKGDFAGLQVSSRKLLQHKDVKSEDLFRAAHLIQIKDAKLAAKFWTRAAGMGVPDDPELVVFAQSIASKLGLENESREFMSRMMQQAREGRGPMKIMSIRQLFKHGEKWRKDQQDIDQKYGAGDIPLHLLAKQKNMSFAEILYWRADKNKSSQDVHHSPRLFTRHGARIIYPISDFAKSKNWNLHLDITSLMMAHKLGILEKLENLFKPLRISRHTVTALIEQRDGLRPHQKSQFENSQTIANLYEKKQIKLSEQKSPTEDFEKIRQTVEEFQKGNKEKNKGKKQKRIKKKRIVVADSANLESQLGERIYEITHAVNEHGFAVSFLPFNLYGLKDFQINTVLRLPESLENRIINCRAVVECLRAYNRISQEKYKEVIRSLGVEGNPHSKASPLSGTKLFLMSGVAGVLARANVLPEVCENFEVFISDSSLAEAEDTFKYYKEMDELGGRLDELISRINDGLDEGIYQFIRIPDKKGKKEIFSDGKFGQEIKSALDLLLFDPQELDVICVDDRALTKHAIRQENKIVVPMLSVNELLSALLYNEEIDEQEYYKLLLELRQSNFRYIPIGEDEIIYHLNLAAIKNGQILETEALSVLRQYQASCLLDKDYLQIINGLFSEVSFITQGTESVANAIAEVWKDEKSSSEIQTARADWILENLYTGNTGCSHLRNKTTAKGNAADDVVSLAFDICNLVMRGLTLDNNFKSLKDAHKSDDYFKWLNHQILTTRYISSPEILEAIAKELKKRFEIAQAQKFGTSQEEMYAGIFMGRFFLSLPEEVVKEISFDQEMLDWLKVKVGNTVNAAGINFDAEEYWKAVEKTISGETVAINSADSDKNYYFQLIPDDEINKADNLFPSIKILDGKENQIGTVQDPNFGVLAPNVKTRLETINKIRNWFDCSQEEFKRRANEIAQIENAIERVTKFYKIRENSMVVFYADLEEKFRRGDVVTWQELMPPSAESLTGYFRIPTSVNEKSFSEIWRDAADSLLNDEELLIVISRTASLPISMPKNIVKRFLKLSDEEKVQLLKKLSPAWVSPIQLLHLANLAARSIISENTATSEIAHEFIYRLYEAEDAADSFAAFHATLSFVNSEFYFWNEKLKFTPETVLAVIWGHATRLYNIQRALGLQPKDIIARLSNRRESYFFEYLIQKPEIRSDCLNPRRISQTVFLTHAAAKIFVGIDEKVLESLEIPELIEAKVLPSKNSEKTALPATKLLCDSVLCEDKLQSIFGGDRFDALSPIIKAESIEILKSENLKQTVKNLLENIIANPKETGGWMLIYTILNDLPIYEDLRNLCLEVLQSATVESLHDKELENPAFLFFAASSQVMNFRNEKLRSNFCRMLLDVFQMLDNSVANHLEVRATLMDAALGLSYFPNDPSTSNSEFADIVGKISEAWKDFSNDFGHAFANTHWNMPHAYAEKWYLLNLNLRTNLRRLNSK